MSLSQLGTVETCKLTITVYTRAEEFFHIILKCVHWITCDWTGLSAVLVHASEKLIRRRRVVHFNSWSSGTRGSKVSETLINICIRPRHEEIIHIHYEDTFTFFVPICARPIINGFESTFTQVCITMSFPIPT